MRSFLVVPPILFARQAPIGIAYLAAGVQARKHLPGGHILGGYILVRPVLVLREGIRRLLLEERRLPVADVVQRYVDGDLALHYVGGFRQLGLESDYLADKNAIGLDRGGGIPQMVLRVVEVPDLRPQFRARDGLDARCAHFHPLHDLVSEFAAGTRLEIR